MAKALGFIVRWVRSSLAQGVSGGRGSLCCWCPAESLTRFGQEKQLRCWHLGCPLWRRPHEGGQGRWGREGDTREVR